MADVTIRRRADDCLDQFRLLIRFENEVQEGDKAGRNEKDYELSRTQEQLARFEMWTGNVGALADGHASLDYRVRNSEDAKQLVVEFLGTLLLALRGATETLKHSQAQSQSADIPDCEDALDPSASSAISSGFQGTEPESALSEVAGAFNPSTESFSFIERAIDRLYRLSKYIRRPSTLGHNAKADNFPITDDEENNIDKEFTDYALQIVRHKYPDISAELREQLAYGIVIRRKRLLYRRKHQRKLSTVTKTPSSKMPEASNKNYLGYDAESTIRGIPILSESPVQEKGGFQEQLALRKALSQTSASGEALTSIPREKFEFDEDSNPSTAFSNTQIHSGPVQVPGPPTPAPGSKEFECPYCCVILPISHTKAVRWRRHVMQDLEPYACVFEKCSDRNSFFADRSKWVSHMRSAHATRWVCTAPEHPYSIYFGTEQEYENHMRGDHAGTFTQAQLPLLKNRSKVPVSATFKQCPLCGWQPGAQESKNQILSMGWDEVPPDEEARIASDRISKHLAGHLEALCTMSLPWQDVLEEAKSDEVESQSAQGGSDDSEQQSSIIHKSLSTLSLLDFEQGSGASSATSSDLESTEYFVPEGGYEDEWGSISWPPYYGHARDPVLQTFLRKLYAPFTGNSRGPKLPAYLVPLDPGKDFYARSYALNAIKDVLCPSPETEEQALKPPGFPRCFAVYGPGGVGKTQIAAQFVATQCHNFDAILWVYAENANKLSQDFKDIAVRLGLIDEDHVDAKDLNYTRDVLKSWLVSPLKRPQGGESSKKEKASWLLVFDGVENGDILNDFWPYDGPGSILITSRNPHSWSTSLELKPFTTSEATEYLLRITGREVDNEERASVVAIAKRLGGLPLALAQMGSIISHESISFSEFLRTYEERGGQQELLHRPLKGARQRPPNYEHSIASIWAFDSLGKGTALLNVLSMLDPDGIPEILFEHDTTQTEHPDIQELRHDYLAARKELLVRSLVTGNRRERKLFIHRLVQDVLRTRMGTIQLRQVFFMCVRLLSSIWPFELFAWRHGNARWDACEELFPHLQRLKDLFAEIVPSSDSFEDYEFARLLIDAGWYRHERGKAHDAVQFNNTAQSICESLKLRILETPECVSSEPNILSQLNYSLSEINHNRGCIALEVNEPVSALKYHSVFNEMMIKELGGRASHDDMRLAISWNELGNAHMLNKNWQKGQECFLKSIDEMKKIDSFQPTMISLPLANVGLAYWLQGETRRADAALTQGLRDRELAFGANDRTSFITGRFLHALGNVKGTVGKADEAHEYHRRTLMHYKTTLGNRHHRTADVFVKVADHNLHLEQYDMAVALLDYALEAYSNSVHYMPEKMRASLKRSKALRGLKRHDEANAELSKGFKIYSQLFQDLVRKNSAKESDRKTRENELTDDDIIQFIAFWSR